MDKTRWARALVLMALLISTAALAADEVMGPELPKAVAKEYELRLKQNGYTPSDLDVYSIGQSHIDAAWKWRVAQTKEKVFSTYGQAIEHMKRFPEFTFSGSSPQYYEWILEQHPELFAEIVGFEKAGRWELVGGMWVEPDGNMPSGESFVRQSLYGQRFYLKHFGHVAEIQWLLDSFGYNRNYPQLVAKAGSKYMWTSKLTWNDTTVFPFHNFIWRSPDGSEVITHICPIVPMPTYFPYAEIDQYKGTRYLLKPGTSLVADYATLPETIEAAKSQDWLNVVGSFYGLGDGGLGPRVVEIQTQLALAEKGYTKLSTAQPMFDKIGSVEDRLPVWDDEMYLEYHRGVLTTQSWIKAANRRVEQLMQTLEALRAVLQVQGVKYPIEQITRVWKTILLQQFHDILPGSSIPEVYQDARKDYDLIDAAIYDMKRAGLRELAKQISVKPPEKLRAEECKCVDEDPCEKVNAVCYPEFAKAAEENLPMEGIVVFNSLGWSRSGPVRVKIPSDQAYQIYSQNGCTVDGQRIIENDERYLLFTARNVPAIGYKTYFVKPVKDWQEPDGGPAIVETANQVTLENCMVRVTVDKTTGDLVSVFDKNGQREYIEGGAFRPLAFYDRPAQYSAWNISSDYLDHPIEIPNAQYVMVTSKGPVFAEVLIHRELVRQQEKTSFEQRVRLMSCEPVVYLELDSDYHIKESLTKLEFNTVLHSDTITAENAYVAMSRPTHPQTPGEKARWEMSVQKWLDLSDQTGGLALLNRGKYGFSLTPDATGYRLSIIKGARYPRANFEAKDVKHQYYTFPVPTGYTDQGQQTTVKLGLLAHQGDWRQAELWKAGYEFNTDLEAVWVLPHDGKLPPTGSFISLDACSTYIGAVKRAEGDQDVVIRLVEAAGKHDTATIQLAEGWKISRALETDLLELDPCQLYPPPEEKCDREDAGAKDPLKKKADKKAKAEKKKPADVIEELEDGDISPKTSAEANAEKKPEPAEKSAADKKKSESPPLETITVEMCPYEIKTLKLRIRK